MEVAQYSGGYNQYCTVHAGDNINLWVVTTVLWGNNISTVEVDIGTVEG